jgi:Ni/Co efflux regulator RcnB
MPIPPIKQDTAMRHQFWKPALLAVSVFAASSLAPTLAGAQDRPAQDHPAQDHPAQDRPDAQHAMRADVHRDDTRGDDAVARYRHDHPHSSARCHDGFFTSTRDRNRACSKHGGIDVWLSL